MTEHILLLHSSCDLRELQDIERQAALDLRHSDWRIWIDASAFCGELDSGTLSAAAPIDEQIKCAVQHAFAVVFVVGGTGAGPYQAKYEVGWILDALQSRLGSDRPLRLVPVLLREGLDSDLPTWMRQYPVVNQKRDLTHLSIWRAVRRRLNEAPPGFDADFKPLLPRPEIVSCVEGIARSLREPHCLTVMIGPYGSPEAPDTGPATLTELLLSRIELSAQSFQPWPPWPAEAAEWVHLGLGVTAVEEVFSGHEFRQISQSPTDLTRAMAGLAKQWSRRHGWPEGAPPKARGWNGLVLLSMRVDLSLEAALCADGVRFTRLTPPAARSRIKFVRDRTFEDWHPSPGWLPFEGEPDPVTPRSVQLEGGDAGLTKMSLDGSAPVLLVKVFGSIDLEGSLLVNSADLLRHMSCFVGIPTTLVDAIAASPQVLLGNGLASSVAQLARQLLLGPRDSRKPRVLIAPSDVSAAELADSLVLLERNVFDCFPDKVREAMELQSICRADTVPFLHALAGRV